jgi:syntaxin 5
MAAASIQDRTSEFKSVLSQAQRRLDKSKAVAQKRPLMSDAQRAAA